MHLALLSSNDPETICDLPLAGELLPALHYACKQGYDDMIPRLLHYCDVTRTDLQGFTPLHYAVERGHPHAVNLLLRPALCALMNPGYMDELLLLASSKGHTDTAKVLIDHGALLEAQNSTFQTSLMVAAAAGHTSTVELLLEQGADEDATDREDGTARLYALKNRHWAVVNLFLDLDLTRGTCELEDMLLSAVENDDPALAILLIHKGLAPDAAYKSSTGHGAGTVLTWAARKGFKALVQLLIDHNASVNLQDQAQWTPLARAARLGHDAVVSLLISHGAKVNFPDNNYTPLQVAAAGQRESTVRLLILHGAIVDDLEVRDLFQRGGCLGGEQLRRLSVGKGAPVDRTDDHSRTLLMRAAEEEDSEEVTRLLVP